MKILFICTGNTCRSPMAEGLFRCIAAERDLAGYECGSAGLCAETGCMATMNAIEVCAELGVDISTHHSRLLSNELIECSDRLIVMTGGHAAALKSAGVPNEKIYVLGDGIPDPYGGDVHVYRKCRDSIIAGVNKLLDELEGEDK